MGELLIQGLTVLVGAWVLWGLWRLAQPRRAFVVQLRAGEPRVVTGTVTPAFLQRLREVAVSHGVQHATVSGVARGRRIALQFSRQLPAPACQQLRNWWAHSGWGAARQRV
jgi:hypothetical protein